MFLNSRLLDLELCNQHLRSINEDHMSNNVHIDSNVQTIKTKRKKHRKNSHKSQLKLTGDNEASLKYICRFYRMILMMFFFAFYSPLFSTFSERIYKQSSYKRASGCNL